MSPSETHERSRQMCGRLDQANIGFDLVLTVDGKGRNVVINKNRASRKTIRMLPAFRPPTSNVCSARPSTTGRTKHMAVLAFLALIMVRPALAHSMNQAAMLLDFKHNSMLVEMQLPVERLQTALGVQFSKPLSDADKGRIAAYIVKDLSAFLPDGRPFDLRVVNSRHPETIEGAPYIVARLRLVPPTGAGADLFDLHCSVLLDRLPAQVILASIRTDWKNSTFANDPQLLAVLHGSEQTIRVDRRNGSWWNGFGSVFKLGMRHIAEGRDHLLFLLALLLPAPLLIRNRRWTGYAGVRRCLFKIAGVVTAFTVGHSITLAAGALDLVRVPSRPIETLIAVSILVSAVHALRPLFPGREAAIAGFFGLIHGLAFATTLAELGLGPWERVASIFGFNLGIETMQLIVVMAALPSLVLLSRTRLYGGIRTAGALFAGIAAGGWIAQRLWDAPNPADAVVAWLAHGAPWLALGFTLLGIAAWRTSGLTEVRHGYGGFSDFSRFAAGKYLCLQ